MINRYRLAAVIFLAMVAACTSEEEAEKACFDKLAADFDSEATLARQSGNGDYAITARESAVAIAVIWSDDDRNACDYVSAGPFLKRK